MVTASLPQTAPGAFGRAARLDNFFFSGMALLLLATVLVGFARTYFLAGIFHAPLPNLLIHIHGAVFSAWILLLVTQTSLVAAGRVDVHRKLGLVGFGLACLMLVVGTLAATDSLRRGFVPPGSGFDPRVFYVIPISSMVIFATLIFFAYRERFNPAAHKRLILIATIALMEAPTGRPPFGVITNHKFMDSLFCWFFLLLLVGYDLLSTRKIHRATLWGGLLMVFLEIARVPIGMTHAWIALAGWLQGLARSVS